DEKIEAKVKLTGILSLGALQPRESHKYGTTITPGLYKLVPGPNCLPLVGPEAKFLRRAAFLKHNLWVTQYALGEDFPRGEFPNQNPRVGKGLAIWVKENRSIEESDIVLCIAHFAKLNRSFSLVGLLNFLSEGADKFGNIYFVRLPQDVSDEIEEDPTGGKIKWEQVKLNGGPNKVEEIVKFHVGDMVSCLQRASLIPGGGKCIIYGTVMGSVGAMLPFTSRDDVYFFSHLEMHLRQEFPPLCSRYHMAYKYTYFPVKVGLYLLNQLLSRPALGGMTGTWCPSRTWTANWWA
ncbi:hypothetical protein HAX54_018033, partial [Datura stramonium]|nr:hypothetical protein [Datura stramonium]